MMKIKIFLLFLTIFIFISIFYEDNFYINIFDFIKCESKQFCLHESAHKYDYERNITESIEWVDAVEDYRASAFIGYTDASQVDLKTVKTVFFPGIGRERLPEVNPFTDSFWQGGWGGYSELYAWLAEQSDADINNIPLALQEFYDMDEINETVKGLGY